MQLFRHQRHRRQQGKPALSALLPFPIAREVFNVRQAAQYIGLSPDTVYKYAGSGAMPGFKIGNRWRFKKSVLDRWMEEQCSFNTNSEGN